MPYAECKIYNDGSHYIAIPHTTKPYRPRRKKHEVEITVTEEEESVGAVAKQDNAESGYNGTQSERAEETEKANKAEKTKIKRKYVTTRKELFERFYRESLSLPKRKRKAVIKKAMTPYFDSAEECKQYVETNWERKVRNLITRRVRMTRKANLQDFNFFVTFTYDSKKHTEESFRKGLSRTLANFCHRKNWKYMGVWERSPEKQRLHFHGLFNIPEGTAPSEFIERNDYSFSMHRRKKVNESTYFAYRFGRNDFEPIEGNTGLGNALAYLMKYIEKTGERIVYSKGLPQFFVSDIMDEDVVCLYGLEDRKLLLYDDFTCLDEGEIIGTVSKETIARMPKCN